MANPVIIKNLNLGGIADSDYLGVQNSVSELVNCDIHSEVGIIKANQALTKDSGSTVVDFILASVPCSNGSTYHFGDTGKIYERESNGTWTVRATASPAAGDAGILSAYEHQGYIYYAMESRLGRIAVPAAGGSWAGRSDSWATFTNGDDTYHPMKRVNGVLYIGDAHYVAQVDGGTFTADALDIEEPLRISALGILDTDLLIGTYIADNVLSTQIIRWNTWSVSFSVSDPIPETGVWAFLETDNFVVVNAGYKGNTYLYDGAQLEVYKKIKGDYSATNKASVRNNANLNFNGMPLFGLSQVTGTGVNLGVYSLARSDRNYPYVLNLEYMLSVGSLTQVEIGSICELGADQFLVSWKNNNDSTYGVDVLNLSTKATAYFSTRVMFLQRQLQTTWGYAYAPYRSLPDSTNIRFYSDVNHAGFGSALTNTEADEDRKQIRTETHIGDANTLRMKVELVPSGNTAPELEMAIFELPNG